MSTWWVAGIAIVWYLTVNQISENALLDSLTALSLLIAFYYALTGVACAVYYRRHLFESLHNFLLIGLGPLVGAGLLTWLLVRSVSDMADPENSYSGDSWLGLGPPLVIGLGIAVAGVIVMIVWRLRAPAFWDERPGWPIRTWSGASGAAGTITEGRAEMSVVLGYDESPGAARALRIAVEVAAAFGETLVLVYGAAAPAPPGRSTAPTTTPSGRPAAPVSNTRSRRPTGRACRPSSRSSTRSRPRP